MNNRNNFKLLSRIFIFVMGLVISIPRFSFAALVTCGNSEANQCTYGDLNALVNNIVQFVLFDVVLPFSILLIIIGGITILLSGGNENKVKKGKSIITSTFIGLIVAFGAWILVEVIKTVLFNK